MDWNSVTLLPWDLILEILGFTTGLLYIWWEYHADTRLWIVSMIMPFISVWLYLDKGLYADFAINIYYFLIAVYGYIVWSRHPGKKSENGLPIRHLTIPVAFCSLAGFIALWTLLYCVLEYLTDSTVPVADAFTTALSIVGMWLLAKKYIEQWIAWIAVDAVCVGLYIYKGIYLYATLYLIYTVIAFFGYFKWKRLMKQQ
ncbi:MAG: nicotinamide riboside transporter PnuC [Muribaculaceae bacterium]|nr:nicotinamide riboside transporter PnuC [Muribaculaceae bacterium]